MTDATVWLGLPFERFYESSPTGMLLTNLEGRIVSANAASAGLLGHAEDELRGLKLDSLLPPSSVKGVELWHEIRSGRCRTGSVNTWLRSRVGAAIPVTLGLARVPGNTTHAPCVLVTLAHAPEHSRDAALLAADGVEAWPENDITRETDEDPGQYDALTGLYSRALFQDRMTHALARAERDGTHVCVLFAGLDNFKQVNDSLGYRAGDFVLHEAGRRITAFMRKSDTVSRFSSDVFAVLLEGLDKAEFASKAAQKLIGAFADPFRFEGHNLYFTASIGISTYPGDGSDAQRLMKNAESAMDHAKAEGRNTVRFYTQELNARAIEHLRLNSELHLALEHGEFVLHYQPLMAAPGEVVHGMEALLRWKHPQKGMVPPLRFIGHLEDSGLIVPVGKWVLRAACAELRKLRDRGFSGLRVAVNISPHQFRQQDFVQTVQDILRDTGLDPAALEIEITETTLMRDLDASAGKLEALARLGVTIAIDDFGTGYSSLSYLKRFPVNTLKIDHGFVRGVPGGRDDVAITEAILAIAAKLGLRVVAEGVETVEQLQFLRERQCPVFQGYLFARPMPADEIEQWLTKTTSGPFLPTYKPT